MELLNKNIKWIILVIVLIIIVSGVSVYATNQYLASQVTYKDGKSVADALNDLYSKLPTKTLLWTNSNPTDNFISQTITLDSSLTNYTYVIIQWKFKKNDTVEYEDIFKIQPYRLDGENNGMYTIGGMDNNIAWVRLSRTMNEEYTKIKFGNVTSNSGSNDNSYLIPVAIYGLNFAY